MAIKANECLGQRFGALRVDENSVANYFRYSRRSRGHNGLARSHRFQEHDAEAFLDTRQAEYVRAVVFLGQFCDRDIAEPAYDRSEVQLIADPLEPRML